MADTGDTEKSDLGAKGMKERRRKSATKPTLVCGGRHVNWPGGSLVALCLDEMTKVARDAPGALDQRGSE